MSPPSARSIGRRLLPEDPFLETYLVRPGGATVVSLGPDERLTVVDSYGGQVAELTVLSPEGADDADALGARADAPATVLRELVRNGNGFLRRLAAPRLDPEEARRGPALREHVSARSVAVVPRRTSGQGRRGRARRPDRRRRAASLRPARRDPADARRGRTASSSSPRRSPSRGSTSASTRRPPSRTRFAPASTSR